MRFTNPARGWALAAAACVLLAAAPAAATDGPTSYDAKDGNGTHRSFAAWLVGTFLHPQHLMEGLFGGAPTVANMTRSGAWDVLSPDTRPASSTITVADTGTASAAGQGGVLLVTGAPTANSFQTQPINGQSSGAIAVTGTFVGTLPIEASYDGGTTYVPVSGLLRGTNARTATITGPAVVSLDVTGATHVRVRASALTSGAPTVQMVFSSAAGMTKLLNGAQLVDSGGGDATDPTTHTVKINCIVNCAAGSPIIPDNGSLVNASSTTPILLGGSGTTVQMVNNGLGAAHYRLCTTSSCTALSTDPRIPPGNAFPVGRGSNLYADFLADSGTINVDTFTGTGPGVAGAFTDFNNPAQTGCRASTTIPTAASDGATVGLRCGKYGGLVQHPFAVRELASRSAVLTLTGTTETSLMAAGGSGVLLDMVSIKACNTSATATRLDIRDVTAGTVQDTWYLPAGQCTGAVYSSPFRQTTANSAWTAQLSGAVTDVRIVAQFVQQ